MLTEHMFDSSTERPELRPPATRRFDLARPVAAKPANTAKPGRDPLDPAGSIEQRERSMSTATDGLRPTAETDQLYRLAVQAERDIGRMRVVQVQAVRAIELATDGNRAPGQLEWWIADRLGLTPTVAHDLVCAARSMSDDRIDEVRNGSITFDRALAETRALVSGAKEEHVRATRPRVAALVCSEPPAEVPAMPGAPAA